VIAFIDANRDRRSSGGLRWGIEPICKQLRIAPSTYHAAKKRPPSARRVRDTELRPEILRVWEENLSVYGADKVWDQLNKDGIRVARCSVERLMRDMGLQGCRRGRLWVRTTTGDETLERPADPVERQFRAPAPNRLWVADLTYVKTHSGWVYVAFIVDVFSRTVVGWQASRSLRSDLAIDALEMAVHNRSRTDSLDGLVHHSDRGVQLSTCRCATPTGSPPTTSSPRSAPRETATTAMILVCCSGRPDPCYDRPCALALTCRPTGATHRSEGCPPAERAVTS
jgi:putative transposase